MREAWEDLIQNGRVPTQTILVKEYGFKRETVKSGGPAPLLDR
jgi:DNA-binding GntR family transcriptional regulator